MKPELIIFDLDGTLTDSAPGILNGVRYAIEKMGMQALEEQVLRRFLGPPLLPTFMSYCGMSEAEATLAQEHYRDYYNAEGALENRVYPGIRQLLKDIQAEGLRMAVATHKPLEATTRILEAFNLNEYFDWVAGPLRNEEPTKGELVRRANPAGLQSVVIGDRASDYLGGRENGADGIAALYGYGNRAEFEKAGTSKFAETVEGIYPHLGLARSAKQGYFISFEGNDGSGKSTQTRLLAKRLAQNGYDVLLTREPGGTRVGEQIRGILLDRENNDMDNLTEAMLYAAARAQHVRQVIRPGLDEGKIVISDRFVDSSLAYQGAGRGLGIELVRAINAPAVDGCLPDTTVFLSLDPETGMQRFSKSREQDRLELAGSDFHKKVAAAFQTLMKDDSRFIQISSQGTKQQTAQLVYDQVILRLREAGQP